MRFVLRFMFLIALLTLLFNVFELFNTYVSMKYEVEEIFNVKNVDQTMLDKAKVFNSLLLSLWTNIFFCVVTMILIADKLIGKTQKNSESKLQSFK
jgi:hypothetical protein